MREEELGNRGWQIANGRLMVGIKEILRKFNFPIPKFQNPYEAIHQEHGLQPLQGGCKK